MGFAAAKSLIRLNKSASCGEIAAMPIDVCLGTASGIDVGGRHRTLTIFRKRRGFYLSGEASGTSAHPSIETLDELLADVAFKFRLNNIVYKPIG